MNRKEQHKHKAETVDKLREKRRQEAADSRKERRQRLMESKRMRLMSAENVDDFEFTEDLVKEIAEKLVKKADNKKEMLLSIRRAFSQGSLLIDAFWSVDNALSALIGILTGSDADLQLDATWCLANMAAGTHEHASVVLKEAGPYLITYLSGSNDHLQDQCLWALGNIAGDCTQCRDTVIEQGMLKPTLKLLKSTSALVVRSAAFALSNLARGEGARTQLLVEEGILPLLKPHLLYTDDENPRVITEAAWVLTYIAASGKHTKEMLDSGIPEALAELIVKLAEKDPNNYHILTPVLRCLGNLCAGPAEMTEHISGYDNLIPALHKFLHSERRFIRKECLWALSNMTDNEVLCKAILSDDMVPTIVGLLAQAFDIKVEAAYTTCNLACQGNSYTEALLDAGAMKGIVPLLKSTDPEVIHSALCFVEIALRSTKTGLKLFEDSDGLGGLEVLEYHSNEVVRSEANQLLDKYFYKDDEGWTKVNPDEKTEIQQNETK